MEALLELIAEQKIILISLVLVALPLVLALLLLLSAGVGNLWRHLRQRRAEWQAEQRLAPMAQADLEEDADDLPEIDPAILALATPPAVNATVLTSKSPTPTIVENPQQATSSVSSGMNDLLASVFIDDEAHARYEILMQGVEPIETQRLLELCQVVANEVYQQYPTQSTPHQPGETP